MSAAPVDFYFEFSSPYGYIASALVDDLAGRIGREVRWRPFLLGPVFKATGSAPLVDIPMKGEYSRHDFERTARFYGVQFEMPPPVSHRHSRGDARLLLGRGDRSHAREAPPRQGALRTAYFVMGKDIGDPRTVMEVALIARHRRGGPPKRESPIRP